MEEFVWLCTAQNDAEAGMMKGILENEGILVQLAGCGIRRLYGMNNFMGVDLQVPQGDRARARELLDAYFQANEAFMEAAFIEEEE